MPSNRRSVRHLAAASLVVVLAAGCDATTPEPTIMTNASRQTETEVGRTMRSLRQVDDLPFYAMTYLGDYDTLAPPITVAQASPFGCSLFVSFGNPSRPLFARNFDWEPHPALLLLTDPPDGFASVSIVDISYLGVGDGVDPTTDAAARSKLLNAPLLPFDGMNEKGLAVGLAEDLSGRASSEAGKPTVSGVRVIRLILDQAATVEQAMAVMAHYNVDFGKGSPLHYLLADATGHSAVVEYVNGRMEIMRGGPPWQALTNFRMFSADAYARQSDRRYAIAARALDAANGAVDSAAAMRILADIAQSHTRWSVTYDMATGAVRVTTRKRWETVHEFQLQMSR